MKCNPQTDIYVIELYKRGSSVQKETREIGKGKSHILLESVREHVPIICKVDHIMKYEMDMICYNEAKPIHFFYLLPFCNTII